MAEWLDIVDENGVPVGEIVDRDTAHRQGIRHRTAHLWLLRRGTDGVQVLLQKRSENKDSYPGCYDISSAGHIPAGVDFVPSALRELKEELGLTARPEELNLCGVRRFFHHENFHGRPFSDNQVSRVYLLWRDVDISALTLQKEEISEVRWVPFDTLRRMVETGQPRHCIAAEEVEMLARAALREYKPK